MTKIKLVIWDLDNTLWNGTVFYKDKESISIKPGTKETLKELSKRNIICSICSKNYYEDAMNQLDKFDIAKYFKNPQIGWGLKSEAIRNIASSFKIGYEEIMFIDDDPFQRAEVQSSIPNLTVIGLDDPLDILNYDGIKPENETEEDKNRVSILKEQRNREEAENNHRGDYKEFLKSCNIKLSLRKIQETDWDRVVQLINRTNELNATLNRYNLEQLREMCEKDHEIWVAELKDNFGNYGLIGEVIVETNSDWFIKDLAISCRTMGRGIGTALINAVCKFASKNKINKVRGQLNESTDNWRMKPLYEKCGFQKVSSEGTKICYETIVYDNIQFPEWLDVTLQ